MEKKMMILGAGPLQIPAIKKAKELGYQIILIDYDESAPGFALADTKLVISTLDQEEVYRQALIYKPDVVITSTSDGPVRTAAYVNERLGKQPDLSYEDSLCATIKSHMRERLKEYHVPIPEYFAVDDFIEFTEAVNKLSGYCIIKPADNAGSRGVVLFQEQFPEEEKLHEVYEYSKGYSKNGIVMVEEYLTGAEVSVEAMTIDGKTKVIAITDKLTTPPPYFVELGHSQPSMLSDEVKKAVTDVTLKAVEAIRLINGPSHTEIKVTQDGPKIIEIAARLGGDFITSKLVPLSTGVDMVGNSVLLASGEAVDIKNSKQGGAAIRFIQGSPGKIQRIVIDERIHEVKGLVEFVLYKKEGDKVNGTQSSNDRLGHVVAKGLDAPQAVEAAKQALECIHIEIVS